MRPASLKEVRKEDEELDIVTLVLATQTADSKQSESRGVVFAFAVTALARKMLAPTKQNKIFLNN